MTVSDLLTIDVTLKAKDEQAVTAIAMAREQDADMWLHLTQEHPLWIRGREVLAQSFEQQKRYEEAVFFRIELTNRERLISRYQDLLVAEAPWLSRVELDLSTMARLRSDRDFAVNVMRERLQYCKPDGDPILEQAFAAKLREWFPQKA